MFTQSVLDSKADGSCVPQLGTMFTVTQGYVITEHDIRLPLPDDSLLYQDDLFVFRHNEVECRSCYFGFLGLLFYLYICRNI